MPFLPIGVSFTFLGDSDENDGSDSETKSGTINKQFQRNKHTVSDVVAYLENVTAFRTELLPTGPTSVTMMGRWGDSRGTFLGHNVTLGGLPSVEQALPRIEIIENDALEEIRPVNTIVVNGAASDTLFAVEDHEINVPTDEYVGAKARHTELYEKAGGTEIHAEPEFAGSANTKGEVENEARSQLKRALDQSTDGSVTARFAPLIEPHDTISVKQTCGPSSSPTRYEVNRVHHKIRADEPSTTEMSVSVPSLMADIEVVDSWEKSTTGEADKLEPEDATSEVNL